MTPTSDARWELGPLLLGMAILGVLLWLLK